MRLIFLLLLALAGCGGAAIAVPEAPEPCGGPYHPCCVDADTGDEYCDAPWICADHRCLGVH